MSLDFDISTISCGVAELTVGRHEKNGPQKGRICCKDNINHLIHMAYSAKDSSSGTVQQNRSTAVSPYGGDFQPGHGVDTVPHTFDEDGITSFRKTIALRRSQESVHVLYSTVQYSTIQYRTLSVSPR